MTDQLLQNPPIWVDKPTELEKLLTMLLNEPVIAVDTESDSLYSYFEKICLIQFSTPVADYVVDPLNVDVSCLGEFFATNQTQKVFHAVEYDLLCLKRDYGFTLNNLFDTMTAARILGWSKYGLGSILQKYFNVKLNKRFQKYNWGERPLKPKALNYARLDTHYLLPLRRIQLKELEERKRLREATDAFQRAAQVEPTPKEFDPDDFWRVKRVRNLSRQDQAIVRELFILRDKIARKLDRPPFKVMNNSTMIYLAQQKPTRLADLNGIKGLEDRLIREDGQDVLAAIQTGQAAPLPEDPRHQHQRLDTQIVTRYETLRHWRNDLAANRGIEPDVIFDNHTLMRIARYNPQHLSSFAKIGALSEWQIKTYGQTLLDILKTMKN